MAKNRISASLLLAVVLGCTVTTGDAVPVALVAPRWKNQFRTPTSSNLRSVRFVSPTTGVIAGEATAIFGTNSGGTSWIQEEHQPFDRGGDIAEIDAVGLVMHAVGSDPSGNGEAWETKESLNWTVPSPALPTGVPFTAVSMATEDVAYYLRGDGEIVRRRTGSVGTTTENVGVAGDWRALKRFASAEGYVGGFETGTANAAVYRRTGANTFAPTSLPGGLTAAVEDFSFLTEIAGYACGGQFVLKTVDGSQWNDVTGAIALGAGEVLRGVHFPLSGQFGCVVGDGAGIYWTGDGATTWNAAAIAGLSVPGVDLYDVWFLTDESTGYAVGDLGVVLKTTDGGRNWIDLSGGDPTVRFNACDFTNNGTTGLAVGDAGAVFVTIDGGTTWTPLNGILGGGILTEDFYGVSIPEVPFTGAAYICGAGGAIYKNSNFAVGGAWSPMPLPGTVTGTPDFHDILFPLGEDDGVCVGDNSVILYRINGGGWTEPIGAAQPVVSAASWRALAWDLLGQTFWVAGTGGVIASSTTLGFSWVNELPPGSVDINALEAPPTLIVFAGGDDGFVYRFLALNLWEFTVIPSTSLPTRDLAFATSSIGFSINDAAGPDGGIFFTDNGGREWFPSPDHTHSTLRGVWRGPNPFTDIGTAVGDDGTILRTTVGGRP